MRFPLVLYRQGQQTQQSKPNRQAQQTSQTGQPQRVGCQSYCGRCHSAACHDIAEWVTAQKQQLSL